MTCNRKRAYRRGQIAEHFAALVLMMKGYRIAERRFRTPVGEIDLVARRGNFVLFVEVKARFSHQAALDSISITAQRRIEAAGHWWLSKQNDAASLSWRFDVITVIPRRWPRHHKDVW